MTIATDMLAAYLTAETALLLGKETQLGDRQLRHEDLPEIRKGRQEWESRVNAEQTAAAGGSRFGGMSIALADLSGQ